jgi:hypothetical protein
MNRATLRFVGLDALKAALRKLPEELTHKAGGIVEAAADDAAEEIAAAYPTGPGTDEHEGGNLKAGVKVVAVDGGKFGVRRVVRSTAKHAHLYEFGTQARHTALGYNRGPMPGAKIFIPAVMRKRRQMYDRLEGVLTEAGLDVRR